MINLPHEIAEDFETFDEWGYENKPVRSTETTHYPLQMEFLITSAIFILNVGTDRWLFNTLKSITGRHFPPALVLEITCCEDLHTSLPELLLFSATFDIHILRGSSVFVDWHSSCELWDFVTI